MGTKGSKIFKVTDGNVVPMLEFQKFIFINMFELKRIVVADFQINYKTIVYAKSYATP